MRILVTTNAAVGHFLPMAPTLDELIAIGHEVLVGCPASFEPFVRRAGFEALACEEIAVSLPAPPPLAADDHEGRLTWAVTVSWPADCRTWVDSLLRRAARWRPELVIVEPVEQAGRIVAAALGLPLVVHGWGFNLPAHVDEAASSAVGDVYERVGAAPQIPALVADLGPAAVQAPDAGPAERFRYRAFSIPGHPIPPARGGERRVLVTLGTYANPAAAAFLRTAAAAALEHGPQVIAVLGNNDRGSTRSFPREVIALPWVDMSTATADCDLVVHHGGAGTSWATVTAGKPAVVLPQGGDQFRNAEILSGAGAALVCMSHAPGDISEAIGRALRDPDRTRRAGEIARDNAALADIAQLAHHIADLRP